MPKGVEIPEPPKGIQEFEEEVEKEEEAEEEKPKEGKPAPPPDAEEKKPKKAPEPKEDHEVAKVKARMDELSPKMRILKWDAEKGQCVISVCSAYCRQPQ